MIEAKPFCLFADCEVIYDGRASSVLQRGKYLIIFKNDRSVSIHANDLITPRNYMGSDSLLRIDDNIIEFKRRKEIIKVIIYNTINITYLEEWASHKIAICRTEKELVQKICKNWSTYFTDEDVDIRCEVPTELGPIDILGTTDRLLYIIEVKRRTAVIKDVTQLLRYVEAMSGTKEVKGFIAAPSISKNAFGYLSKHNLGYLEVQFDG